MENTIYFRSRRSSPTPPVETNQEPIDLRREAADTAFSEYKAKKVADFNFFTENNWQVNGDKWKKSFSMGSKAVKNKINMALVVEFDPESSHIRNTKPEYK